VLSTYRNSLPPVPVENAFYLDLAKVPDIRTFAELLKERGEKFSVVLFIAGHTPSMDDNEEQCRFGGPLSSDVLHHYLQINCFSQLILFEALSMSSCLSEMCKVVFFSSLAGSIELRGKMPHHVRGGNLAYRISKGALNVAVKNIAYDLEGSGKIVVAIHPGWVKTRSGGDDADLEVEYSSRKIYDLVVGLKPKDHGKFLIYNGDELRW
jgi:NAD(P)-dependent dehydrogenase (short-subunit alcohol dehydrogenase family)